MIHKLNNNFHQHRKGFCEEFIKKCFFYTNIDIDIDFDIDIDIDLDILTQVRLTGEFFTKKVNFLVLAATRHVGDYQTGNRSALVIFREIKKLREIDLQKIPKYRKNVT